MSSPFYIVDGSGYIFRAFYAVHSLTTKTGFPTNALFGFTRMMTKLIREIGDARLGVCFDLGEPTFRHAMYDQYKANRDECPEDLVKQMPYFRKIVRALNLEVLEQAGVEADDIIGSLTLRFKSEAPIIIVSGDKDLCQLVGPGVTVWDAMRDIRYDPAGVKAKFGVYPEQIIDYLTLVGDSSDNVPGVKGIGPKTAVQLLEHFQTLDAILEDPTRITEIKGLRGASSIRTKIEEGFELIRLSKRLVTLKTDVAPFYEWPSVESFQLREPDGEALKALFQELEFDALLTGLSGRSASGAPEKVQKQYHCVNVESLRDVVAILSRQPAFAFDTETSSLDPLTCDLAGISISWREGEAYYFPIGARVDPERNLPIDAVRAMLGPIFADPTKKKYGLNLKFDLAVLRTHGFVVDGITFDSMLASYVLSPDRRQHNLAALTERYLSESMESYSTLTAGKESICDVPLDDVTRYACHDAEASFRLEEKLAKELIERDRLAEHTDAGSFPSLQYVLQSIEMPLVRVLEDMERNGIRLDLELLNRFDAEFVAELATLERDIHELAGEPFNINSPKQLSVVLFEKLAIPSAGLKRTQSGISTDASVLERLASQHPIVTKLLDYRELHKLKTTYVDALKTLVVPTTCRIHTSFNQAVAATGRLSSTEPNLQNIPIRNPRGRQIRQAFVAEEGHLLLSVDYSQIELRVLAHLCGDSNLQAAFHRGDDIHLATARELFGAIATGDELKRLRRIAKTINFGIVYGMGAFRLAGDLDISRREAQNYIDSYFARYPRVQAYFDETEAAITARGYVETMFGRRRYLSDIDSSGRDKGYALRSLLNAPIQGSAAEIMKLAMIRVWSQTQKRDDVRMVLQVHDELVFEVRADHVDDVRDLVVREMEAAVELAVPLKVDVRLANNWG